MFVEFPTNLQNCEKKDLNRSQLITAAKETTRSKTFQNCIVHGQLQCLRFMSISTINSTFDDRYFELIFPLVNGVSCLYGIYL